MKTLIILIASLVMTQAQAAEKNSKVFEVEQSYLRLADDLSDIYQTDGPCGGGVEVYTPEIAKLVQQARYAFDSNREWNNEIGRLFTLPASVTKTLADTLFLKDVMNMLDREDPSTFAHALNRVVMWGPAPGAYGNTTLYRFKEGNKIEYQWLELLDSEPYWQWHKVEGTFQVTNESHKIIVSVEVEGMVREFELFKTYDAYSGAMWVMIPRGESKEQYYRNGFVDFPSECEA